MTTKTKRKKVIFISECGKCPFKKEERTMGAGYAEDWICTKKNKKIAGYIEWPSEEPKEIPTWCPLKNAPKG